MRRRELILFLSSATAAAGVLRAQQPVIGYLFGGS
jgi:hypothetical protein